MEKRPATMRDIARLAGVNQSTVSRALNSSSAGAISAPVRRRVLSIARTLRYHRNPSAVALRTGATKEVLVVITDITDSYFSSIISGIEAALVREGFSMILHSLVHAESRPRLEGLFHTYRLDGALLLGALPDLPGCGDPVSQRPRHPAGADRPHRCIRLHQLRDRGQPAGRVPLRLAPRRPGSPTHRRDARTERLARFPPAPGGAAARGLAARPPAVSRSATTRAGPGRRRPATRRPLELLKTSRPTALVCLNDATAFGSIRAAAEQGLRVPRDISVIGFDDDDLAAYADPPLTTIHQPRLEMGIRGTQELLAAMKAQTATTTPAASPATTTILDVSLVVRSSTCPPA